jgi:hypothetical protein
MKPLCILFRCWNTCTRFHYLLSRQCECPGLDKAFRRSRANDPSYSPPSVDPTGDLLTLVPLRDPANITAAPAARAASPTPSSTSTAVHSVLSTTTTSTAATSTTGVASSSPAKCLRFDSLFNMRRGYHIPLVSLTERKDGSQHNAPPAPSPVSLGPADWRSWLGGLVGSASVTGDEIDALCT